MLRDLVTGASVVTRSWVALAVAAVSAIAAAIVALMVISATHLNCTWETGGDAGTGTWACGDGIEYLVLLASVSGLAGFCTLVLYAAIEARFSDSDDLRTLAELATTLGAGVLVLASVFLLAIGFPLWFPVPYLVVGAVVFLVRGVRVGVYYAVLGAGIVVCLLSVPFLLTAPATVVAALVWTVAIVLRRFAARRELVERTDRMARAAGR